MIIPYQVITINNVSSFFFFSLKYAQELSGSCQRFRSSIHLHSQSQSQSITKCAQERIFNSINTYLGRVYHMRYITKASCLPFIPYFPPTCHNWISWFFNVLYVRTSNDTVTWSPPSRTSPLTLFSLEWSNEITDTFQD